MLHSLTQPIDSRTFGTNCASNSSCKTKWASSWQTSNFCILQDPNNDAYHSQRPYEAPISTHTYVNQQPPSPMTFDFNQSIVELFRHQTKYHIVLSSSTYKLQMTCTHTSLE